METLQAELARTQHMLRESEERERELRAAVDANLAAHAIERAKWQAEVAALKAALSKYETQEISRG